MTLYFIHAQKIQPPIFLICCACICYIDFWLTWTKWNIIFSDWVFTIRTSIIFKNPSYVQIVIHTLLISVCLHMPDNMTTLQMLTPTPNMNKVSITCVYMQVKMLTLLKISHHILCVIFSRNSMGVPLHTASFVLVDFNLGVSLIILGR